MFRGERFTVDLSDDEGDHIPQAGEEPGAARIPILDFVNDIKERDISAPPPAPTLQTSARSGFPEHKKRTRVSSFKQRRQGVNNGQSVTDSSQPVSAAAAAAPPTSISGPSSMKIPTLEDEKREIDLENRKKLAAMSDAQVKEERDELIASLPPSLLEAFLKRANIDQTEETEPRRKDIPQGSDTSREASEPTVGMESTAERTETTKPKKSVSFADTPGKEEADDSPSASPSIEKTPKEALDLDDIDPKLPRSELHKPSEFPLPPIHFPTPPSNKTPPNLDPNSPTFFEDLQKHYFPNMPVDPSSLSWMQPSTSPYTDAPTDERSAYHPQSTSDTVPTSGIRFSMTGNILSPRTSLKLPTSLGLHHHAADPEAAGYTIPELAILSRSVVPAQRCIAWQTLGRILYRLGSGEFGEPGSDLVDGLWGIVEKEEVILGMMMEAGDGESDGARRDLTPEQRAARIGKHASAKAYATEALWLWRRSGSERGIKKVEQPAAR
ncbi:transcription factor Rba50 [Ascosphaera apis ARSEF 7405]|uniref:Transcription factor Rba50 n=1 Tax=Ascosphaera apis ARSEF 7405 TaxID=392613 RepID=A0A167WIU6_9EURO|nr:transcription factor Rba50 [Ascosphaera apis ARSEF 7405]